MLDHALRVHRAAHAFTVNHAPQPDWVPSESLDAERGRDRQQNQRDDHHDAPREVQREATNTNGRNHSPHQADRWIGESENKLGDHQSEAARTPSSGEISDEIVDEATPEHEEIEQQEEVDDAGRNSEGV